MSDYGTDIADAPVGTGADASVPEAPSDYTDEPVDLAEAPAEAELAEAEESPPVEDLSEPVAVGADDEPESLVETEEAIDLGEAPDTVDVASEEPREWQEGEVVDLGRDETSDAPQEVDAAEADDFDGSDLGAPDAADAQEVKAPVDDAGEDLTTPTDADMVESVDTNDPSANDTVKENDDATPEAKPDASDIEPVSDTDVTEESNSLDVAPEGEQETSDVEPDASVEELTDASRDEARPAEDLRAEYDPDLTDTPASDAPRPSHQADVLPDLGNSPKNEALTSALADKGLSLEPVDRFDYSDNPVLGYRDSAPAEDVAYAVNAWNDQIAPGIASGATRDDLAAYDHEHGLEGHQQLAGVYDYMLGSDAIKSGGERGDGSLDVTGGRHRLEQARLSGVQYLPVKN